MTRAELDDASPLRGTADRRGHRLTGKVALVTGASRGIGEAIARRLSSDGAKVALAARSEADCERIAEEINAAGGESMPVSCDVTLPISVSNAIAGVVSKWGRIDILVNNAGLGGPTPIDNPDDSRWNSILATNLTAVFRVIREAAPFLPEGGRIVNIASVLGRFGVAGHAAYCASKHGVIGLTRAVALELAPRKITVNAICPGWVETEMSRESFRRIGKARGEDEQEGREIAEDMTPLKRILKPEEVAGLVSYLASGEAKNLTGQAIVLDGGQVMP